MEQRLHAFDGVRNFRDFGGYAGAGGRLRTGRLFRSAHLAEASAEDVLRMAALDLALVADLRRPGERAAEPSRLPQGPGPDIVVGDVAQGDAEDLPPHLRFLRDADAITETGCRDYMLSSYRRMPFEPRHVSVFKAVFRHLAEGGGPVLIHCAAGKDRTGVLAALVHHALGVDAADLRADYDLTNTAHDLAGLMARAERKYAKRLGRTIDPGGLAPMVRADVAYLEAAFAVITERCGTIDAYLAEILDAGPDVIAAMRRHLVAPSTETAPA